MIKKQNNSNYSEINIKVKLSVKPISISRYNKNFMAPLRSTEQNRLDSVKR